MITLANFQYFKALRNVDVTFESRLTVLVGPNGSGKTSVLQGLQFLGNFTSTGIPPNMYTINSDPRLGGESGSREVYGWEMLRTTFDLASLETGTRFIVDESGQGDKPIRCTYRCEQHAEGKPGHQGEQATDHNLWVGDEIVAYKRRTEQRRSRDLSELRWIRSAVLLRLDPAKLASPSLPVTSSPTVGRDGGGLPSAIAHLQRKYPSIYREVVNALASVVPNITDVRLDYQPLQGGYGDVLLFDFKGATSVPATSVSDGTLLVLGLLTIILNPNRPQLILLDDLDHGLHPKAQMSLVDLLHKLLQQFPELQVIATAHSPYILDRLKPNEVRVMALKDDGSADCKPLTEHPKYPMWKDSMSPGEFWSHAGEDWVKQLTPQTSAP